MLYMMAAYTVSSAGKSSCAMLREADVVRLDCYWSPMRLREGLCGLFQRHAAGLGTAWRES